MFWEGRFKSQALLDEAAVLTCMAYVYLNPVRAKIADTPETSDYTSIRQRNREIVDKTPSRENAPTLMPLLSQGVDHHPNANAIAFTTLNYLELVDWAGRIIREYKRGAIPPDTPPILERMGLEADAFVKRMRGHKGRPHPLMLGPIEKIREAPGSSASVLSRDE